MAANNYQFIQTRNMFRDYLTGYPQNLDFNVWNNAPAEDKAALLFVTFYQEITLAWNNAVVSLGIVCISQDDGVSTVLQYLMKNVDKISTDEKRYSPKYIYTVCYNCLLGLWKSRGTEMQRSGCEISPDCEMDGAFGNKISVNLWDLVPSEDDDPETVQVKETIWNVIRHMGPKAEKVVNHIINPGDSLHKVSAKAISRNNDRLADVSVTEDEYVAIVEELKVKLAPYKDAILAF